MKDKIIIFVIGVLVGAVLATGAFYIYTLNSEGNNVQMNGGQPPELPSGENGNPPEKPNGENGSMPNGENTQSNN